MPRDVWEAIEFDLLGSGFVLADIPSRVTWRTVRSVLTHSQRGSAVWAHFNSSMAEWGVGEQLLALVADSLRIANWQRTVDGSKGRRQPEPLPRPWDEPKRKGVYRPRPNDGASQKFGRGAIPASDFRSFWRGAA